MSHGHLVVLSLTEPPSSQDFGSSSGPVKAHKQSPCQKVSETQASKERGCPFSAGSSTLGSIKLLENLDSCKNSERLKSKPWPELMRSQLERHPCSIQSLACFFDVRVSVCVCVCESVSTHAEGGQTCSHQVSHTMNSK